MMNAMSDSARTASIDAHLARPWAARGRAPARPCAWPGCCREGLYRAPRSREDLRDFLWMCLEHVREHNRRWDYFAGMDSEAIERHRRADVTWHRPTWRFGVAPGGRLAGAEFYDPLGLLGERRPRRSSGDDRAQTMMRRLGLAAGFTLAELKARFKLLVKRHHPDLRGGDRSAEGRLREIIEAYRFLLDHRLHR